MKTKVIGGIEGENTYQTIAQIDRSQAWQILDRKTTTRFSCEIGELVGGGRELLEMGLRSYQLPLAEELRRGGIMKLVYGKFKSERRAWAFDYRQILPRNGLSWWLSQIGREEARNYGWILFSIKNGPRTTRARAMNEIVAFVDCCNLELGRRKMTQMPQIR